MKIRSGSGRLWASLTISQSADPRLRFLNRRRKNIPFYFFIVSWVFKLKRRETFWRRKNRFASTRFAWSVHPWKNLFFRSLRSFDSVKKRHSYSWSASGFEKSTITANRFNILSKKWISTITKICPIHECPSRCSRELRPELWSTSRCIPSTP